MKRSPEGPIIYQASRLEQLQSSNYIKWPATHLPLTTWSATTTPSPLDTEEPFVVNRDRDHHDRHTTNDTVLWTEDSCKNSHSNNEEDSTRTPLSTEFLPIEPLYPEIDEDLFPYEYGPASPAPLSVQSPASSTTSSSYEENCNNCTITTIKSISSELFAPTTTKPRANTREPTTISNLLALEDDSWLFTMRDDRQPRSVDASPETTSQNVDRGKEMMIRGGRGSFKFKKKQNRTAETNQNTNELVRDRGTCMNHVRRGENCHRTDQWTG